MSATYATVQGKNGPVRLAAEPYTDDPAMILVWIVNGGTIGGYKLERFQGGKLTAGTLRRFFETSE